MSGDKEITDHFTDEMIELALRIWVRSAVSLIDVRKKELLQSKAWENYQLPASMFVFTQGGPASVSLNNKPYQTGRYGLFHAGKGTVLSITPQSKNLQAYMVLYRAETAPFYKREINKMLERLNPFTQVYGFSPENPLFFMDRFCEMFQYWNEKSVCNQFYTKVLLYQMIHQLYMELHKGKILYMEPDYIEWTKSYLDQHFSVPLSIDKLARMLPISRSMLGKLFRKREQKSIQEYLNEKRLNAAKAYLQNTNTTIQEVATGCGFVDELNLNRMFKKYIHMTPSEYRRKRNDKFTKNDIDNDYQRFYNEKETDDLNKFDRGGAYTMFARKKSKQLIAAAAISLLLLSACSSGAPASREEVSSSPNSQSSASESKGSEAAEQMRVIKTVKGDVKVPLNPQRVVVLFNIGDVLAFGITPIAVDKFPGQVYYEEIQHITERPNWTEPEGMMALDPDLIIIWGDHFYDSLKSVAPVIIAPDNLEERITLLGEVFGMEEKATELLNDYEDKLQAASARIRELGLAGKTFTVVEENFGEGGSVVMWYKSQAYNVIYSDLGLQAHPKFVEEFPDAEHPELSMEVAGQYMGDYIFHVKSEEGDQFGKSPVWNSIPAIQNGNIMELKSEMFYWADIKSANAQLEVIMQSLEDMDRR